MRHGLTMDDFNEHYKYAGGNQNEHASYWNMLKLGIPPPPLKDHCVCGTRIVEQCYMYSETFQDLIVMGNCCIKKYAKHSTRTCERCDKPHRNRTVNRCNACKNISQCTSCDKFIKGTFTLCYTCRFPNTGRCDECDCILDKKWKTCYTCRFPSPGTGVCIDCEKTIAPRFTKCYNCSRPAPQPEF